tara:strand:+ start:338 stop:595 length:258 start_codon:yes stop_codon:yes gene_type:complete
MNIPKVSLDTMNSTTISMTNNKEFWKTTMQRMLEENPLLYQLLAVSESNDISTEDYSEGYKRGALLMYILLSNQGEAEDMNELWG